MNYFSPKEFQGFYKQIDPALLELLDNFRHDWGYPVKISPAAGAVGRTTGTGFHNYRLHGMIKAIDVMPSGLVNPSAYKEAVDILTKRGALGIGVYPMWKPSPGIHMDVGSRPGRSKGTPATWSAFPDGPNGGQVYYSLAKALQPRK